MTIRLLWFYLFFYSALGLGIAFRRFQHQSATIMRVTIFLIDAPLFFYSFWQLDLIKARDFAPIPLFAIGLFLATLAISPRWAKQLLANRSSQGSFILSAAFSNIGTTGGAFICYLLFGLPGLSLGYLYLLPYPLLIFTFGFATATYYSTQQRLSLLQQLHNLVTNPMALIPLLAITAGFLCNLSGFKPWSRLEPGVDAFIKAGLFIQCCAIGMTLKPSQLFSPWKPIAAMGMIKFLISPLLAGLLVFLIYGSFASLPAKIIVIQAAMPPAIYAVITATLFKLDRELVNALWLSTTLLLIPVVAVLFLLFG